MATNKKPNTETIETSEPVAPPKGKPTYEELLAQLEAEKQLRLELEDELTPMPMGEMLPPPVGKMRVYLAKVTRQEGSRITNPKGGNPPGFRAKLSMVICLPQVAAANGKDGAIVPSFRYQVMASQDDKTHCLNVFSLRPNRDNRPFRGETVRTVQGYQIQFRGDRMSQTGDVEVFSWEEAILKGLEASRNARGKWPKWLDVEIPAATGKHIPLLGSDTGDDEDDSGGGKPQQAQPASAERVKGAFQGGSRGSQA